MRQYPGTTPRGFEPLRSKTTHLAGEPLNHSGKVSFCVPNHGYPTPQPYMGLKSTEKQTHSMSGNRTRGVCVTGRNVTNYTNTDMLSVKQPSTFLILRTPILKERGVPSRPKSHPSIILQWLSHIPSDIIGPNQYCGEPRPMLLVLILIVKLSSMFSSQINTHFVPCKFKLTFNFLFKRYYCAVPVWAKVIRL